MTNLTEVTNDTRRRLWQGNLDQSRVPVDLQAGERMRTQAAPAVDPRLANAPAANAPSAGQLRADLGIKPLAPAAAPATVSPIRQVAAGIPSTPNVSLSTPPAAPAGATITQAPPAPAAGGGGGGGRPPTPPPVTAPAAPAQPNMYQRMTQAVSGGPGREFVPQFNGSSRIADLAGRAVTGVTKAASRYLAPAVEGWEVAKVAMDPQASKTDVASQAAEGTAKVAGGYAGALAGGALGSTLGPVGTVVGAGIGGLTGYFGVDALANKARQAGAALGVGEATSPAERTNARIAASEKAKAATTASTNTTTNANGSKVQTLPDGSQVMVQRPSAEPAAKAATPAAKAGGGGAIEAVKNQATRPRAAQPAKAPAAAAAAPAADMSPVQARIQALHTEAARDLPKAGARVENGLPFIDMAVAQQADPEWFARHQQRSAILNELSGLMPQNPNTEIVQGGQRYMAAPENGYQPVPLAEYRNTIAGVVMPNAIARSGDAALQQQFIDNTRQGAVRTADPVQAQMDLERVKDEGAVKAAGISAAGGVQQAQIQAAGHRDVANIQAASPKNNVLTLDEQTTGADGSTVKRQQAYTVQGDKATPIASTGAPPLPPGMKQQIGTSGGKPVYQGQDGKRYIGN